MKSDIARALEQGLFDDNDLWWRLLSAILARVNVKKDKCVEIVLSIS